MKANSAIIFAGIVLIILGTGMFYSIQSNSSVEPSLRFLKHLGTFAGLSGIGVVIAGILLVLTGKQQPPIHGSLEDA